MLSIYKRKKGNFDLYLKQYIKKRLKVNHRSKCEACNYTTSERKHRGKSLSPWIRQKFLRTENTQAGIEEN